MAAAQAGLRATSGGNFAIPLTEVHFRAKLLDLAAEVKRNLGYSWKTSKVFLIDINIGWCGVFAFKTCFYYYVKFSVYSYFSLIL